jgi:DNA-binding XRE family transcriptional regulator
MAIGSRSPGSSASGSAASSASSRSAKAAADGKPPPSSAEPAWSQQDLAERLEVSRQSVNAIETGKYDPSLPLASASPSFSTGRSRIFVSPSRRSSAIDVGDSGAAAQLTAPPVECRFDAASFEFAEDAQAQARCLLRHVEPGGSAGPEQPLPPTLAELIGKPASVDPARLAAAIRHAGIPLPTATPVSETLDHHRAIYFVIHDTSSPWIGDKGFPEAFGRQPTFNDVSQFLGKDAVAHAFNDRLGRVTVGHDFEVGWRATKLERILGESVRGRFLHVENVQPRREDPSGPPHNDRIGPDPGFTHAQYRTLALLYVLAGERAGTWLIPAFHANIDRGIEGAR